MKPRLLFTAFWIISVSVGFCAFASLEPDDGGDLPVTVEVSAGQREGHRALEAALPLPCEGPVQLTFYLHPPGNAWTNLAALEGEIFWPSEGSTNAQVLLHMMDWDYLWFQNLLPGYLRPGQWTRFRVGLLSEKDGWVPVGHHAVWSYQQRIAPVEFAVRVFSSEGGTGLCRVAQVRGVPWVDRSSPWIRQVTPMSVQVPCYEKLELRLALPDRYANPFDPKEVHLVATFEGPDGRTVEVDGYPSAEYYRTVDVSGETLVPQGALHWKVRYAPTVPGRYRYSLRVRDRWGEATWGPASFEALPPRKPGFVRVSRRDPRHFEHDDGSPWFPIGHNIRSPYDERANWRFPWRQRWPEGSAAYARYFRAMAKHGENFTEIWMAPWSLGLEWTPLYPGYHGIGWYNLRNAWELDRVLEEAEGSGIYLNLVIHNHGKFGLLNDKEWADNPFNVEKGGYLRRPDDYFTDVRAMESFRNLMRYIIARWGYSPHIMAWQLWSELDLTGSEYHSYRRPEVVEWHRVMGRAIKQMDPYDHLVTTHVCGDYTHQHPPILELPEIDAAAVDAYHGSPNPLHILRLMKETAQFNARFGKPVLITEFGGSAFGQGLKHLRETLHAGLWGSVVIPLAGAPMLWWWQIVEEENFYSAFPPLRAFLQGEDRRDPTLQCRPVEIVAEAAPLYPVAGDALRNDRYALGWIYTPEHFTQDDPLPPPAVSNLVLCLRGVTNGDFRIEFWDTRRGKPVHLCRVASDQETLACEIPPFVRDLAFKVRLEPAP